MKKQLGSYEMRELAKMIDKKIKGLGFALFVFPFYEPGMFDYISNAQRDDMIKLLKETLDRFENEQFISTPERN